MALTQKGKAKFKKSKSPKFFIISLAAICIISALLLSIRIIGSDSSRYIFLYWNLLLAGLVPLFAWWLATVTRTNGWLSLKSIVLAVVWLLFLPNSFYIITDFIHLRETYEAALLYDIALLMSFVTSGMILGYSSVYLVHREILKKLRPIHAWYAVSAIFLLSSFAIYLGRFSRWNTWDVILAPAGLLFDVSDRVVNPAAHTETYVSTLTVFVLLVSIYWVIWEAAEYLRSS